MKSHCLDPILLYPLRFTPLSRTPWAGRRIVSSFKGRIPDVHQLSDDRVGESWEFSCDPDFPSYLLDQSQTLPDFLQKFPEAILSPQLLNTHGANCEILVKLLNAAMPLSLQVHPKDDDPALAAHECGKPESWLVLDAEPGAGLYLGFSRKISKADLKQLLMDGDRAKEVLQFVEVKKGDYFEIEPGVPHAIGPGVTLLEPQRIVFGKSGKTYRLWDWGRRYNSDGTLNNETGRPRELHIDEALRIIDPEHQVGESFIKKTQRVAEVVSLGSNSRLKVYPSNPFYQLRYFELAEPLSFKINCKKGYGILICLKGSATLVSASKSVTILSEGYTSLIPFHAWPIELKGSNDLEMAFLVPATVNPEITVAEVSSL